MSVTNFDLKIQNILNFNERLKYVKIEDIFLTEREISFVNNAKKIVQNVIVFNYSQMIYYFTIY